MNRKFDVSKDKTKCKRLVSCIAIFTLLSVLPIARIHVLAVIVPLYVAILILLRFAKESCGARGTGLTILAGIGSVGMVIIYTHFLLPHRHMISLGTTVVSNRTASEVLFTVSGLYALFTIVWHFLELYRCLKQCQ